LAGRDRNAPEVVGKLVELVEPAIYAFRSESKAIQYGRPIPNLLEYTSEPPSELSFITNTSLGGLWNDPAVTGKLAATVRPVA